MMSGCGSLAYNLQLLTQKTKKKAVILGGSAFFLLLCGVI